ncbi:MAG: glycogen/starch/alpha-glucan family phosphorylase [Parachlamydiales bacterium]|nr:glycogen/starch/alpha-glucan family phosphorylase [Parachlamydiales bacterium]
MDIESQADIFAQKIKHLIITSAGRTSTEATTEEFYHAFCLALREEIMVNHSAALATFHMKKPRMLNYISMEHMPGRFLGNNITNMGADKLVQCVLKKMDRNLEELIACEADPGLGNGGLGRLASCFIDSLATLNYPARAYGLRYQYGIFDQEIWDGAQVEKPDCWLLNENPWEQRRDAYAANIHFRGTPVPTQNKHGDEVHLLEDFEEVRALPYDIPILGYCEKPNYSVLLLRLWSTKESPRNFALQRFNAGFLGKASENTALTDVLYPNDNNELGKRVRLKQEFVLVSASLQDILRRHLHTFGDLSSFADKVRIQINDTHPALMIAEIIRLLTKKFDYSWGEAWEICQTVCSYTNHTILREALEEWNEARMHELLPRQFWIIQKLNQMFCDQVRAKYPGDEEKVRRLSVIEGGQVRMAHLAILGSHKVNGVSKLHGQLLKEKVFRDFAEMSPDKFTYVTNGVTQRRWLLHANPLLAEFISKRIGKAWICNFTEIEKLAAFAGDDASQKEFLEIKKKNKERFLEFVTKENMIRDAKGKIVSHSHVLDPNALFDVQVKRIHEYKRQLMNVLHLIMVYQEPERRKVKRLSIFAGKAAPGYVKAKQIIQLTCALERKFHQDERIKEHLCIAFVEDYNVSRAEMIIPAADLSEQISTAGWEASGTGNMKLSMNGALTIGTEDGANIEMREAVTDRWWPFSFGAKAEENSQLFDPKDVLNRDIQIRQAVETLRDQVFAENADEASASLQLYESLVERDTFRVLKDLRQYYETQKKVEELYLQPKKWAEMAIHNIAAMGRFSSDESIRIYAKNIWGLEPCPPDPILIAKVQEEYSEHDRCKIR